VRAILQRVSRAEVRSQHEVLGSIQSGFLVLLGVAIGDSEEDAAFIADKAIGLRVFADAEGKMNLSLKAIGGEMLVVSQFTLLADTEAGRRPSFTRAAPPDDAHRLYSRFVSITRERGIKVECGRFGASMEVELVNDGPVTIVLDSRIRK